MPALQQRLAKRLRQVRSNRYMLHRCPHGHGHFIAFAAFMAEKGFVRQLSPAEVQQLAVQIRTVHCTGCGAAVDIRNATACPYCQAAFTVLDTQAVDKALAGYHQAQSKHATAPTAADFAMALASVEMQREKARTQERLDRTHGLSSDEWDWGGGLLDIGLELLERWVRR